MICSKKIKNKMQALVLENVGDLRLEERDVPSITKDEVLVEVKNCGICSSDIERVFVTGTYHFPTIPGHEFAGEIVGVYDEADKELLTKRAAIFPLMPCMKCSACLQEEYAQCKSYNYFGSRCDGGYSEYLAVPKWNLVFFDKLDYAVAAMCEPASVAIHSLRRVDIKKGDRALIIGTGTIGLLLGLFAKNKGIDVYMGGRNKEALAFSKSLGLNTIDTTDLENEVSKVTDGEGFSYVFEAVGTNTALEQAILSCANFAKIVTIGNPKDDIQIPKNVYWKILRKQLTLTGTWNSSYGTKVNDWRDALAFMSKNEAMFQKLITHKFSLEESKEAFDILRDKSKLTVKVMFKMEDNDEKR